MVTFRAEETDPSVDWWDRKMDREKGKERTVKVTVNLRQNTKGEHVGKMMKPEG